MASYKYGYEPPTRPTDQRSRRMGTVAPLPSSRCEEKEEVIHISGPIDWRKAAKSQPTASLPRPRLRDPSPTTRSNSEKSSSGSNASTRGSGKQAVRSPPPGNRPELKKQPSRNVLRRKPSTISQHAASSRRGADSSSIPSQKRELETTAISKSSVEAALRSEEAYNAIFDRSRKMAPMTQVLPPIIPELDRYQPRLERSPERIATQYPFPIATHDLPPPTPQMSGSSSHSGMSSHHRYSGYSGSGYSASPSIGFSESPGPGAFSRNTTPTSMSSQSPSVFAPAKISTPKLRQGSPAMNRPPVTRRRAGSGSNQVEEIPLDPRGLPSLRESVTSSSSGSTVKGDTKTSEKKKKKRLSPPPPSPPPRKSSQKFTKSGSKEGVSPSKSSKSSKSPKPVTLPDTKAKVLSKSPTSALASIPARPSRKNTPDLHSQIGGSVPIIQSNLASLHTTTEKLQPNIIRPTTTSPSPKLPEYLPAKVSRLPSPSPSQGSYREATPVPTSLSQVPPLKPAQSQSSSRNVSRSPSPIANSKPRFGLFRRTKPVEEEKDRAARKGPAAGTGHEGYGRFGLRGRSSSAQGAGRGGGEVSRRFSGSSQTSVASNDPFLLDRMSPVVIAGGGEIIENRNASSELSRTDSNQSFGVGRPSLESRSSSKTSLDQGRNDSRTTLWPAIPPRDPRRLSGIAQPGGRRPSDGSIELNKRTSLAMRRSSQDANNSTSAFNVPKTNERFGAASLSLDTGFVSDGSQLEMKMERGRKVELKKPKKLEKRTPSPKKWNFFHRSKPDAKPKDEAAVKVTLGKPSTKPMPHYAMMDSSDDQSPEGLLDMLEMEELLREDSEQVALSNEELDALQFDVHQEARQRIENLQASLASPTSGPCPAESTSTPLETPSHRQGLFTSPELIATPELQPVEVQQLPKKPAGRPSRLQQVGRIPKVVSARPEATSPKSFSRPFARLSTLQPSLDPSLLDKESVAKGPSPPESALPEPPFSNPFPNNTIAGLAQGLRESFDSKADSITNHRDFLVFSPRKNSEATTSSSSGPSRSYEGTIAIIPDPSAALVEDEVWDEYDDLIENEEPGKEPPSATSSHGHPFQYEKYESRNRRKSSRRLTREPSKAKSQLKREEEMARDSEMTSSSVYSQEASSRSREVPTPETPMSFSDFFSGYGDRNNSGIAGRKPNRGSNESRRSQKSSASNGQSRRSMLNTFEEDSNVAQVNLRIGSMTVSKWLTFGHVVFSPAREQVMGLEGSSKRHSILIIDGLGNGEFRFASLTSTLNIASFIRNPLSHIEVIH